MISYHSCIWCTLSISFFSSPILLFVQRTVHALAKKKKRIFKKLDSFWYPSDWGLVNKNYFSKLHCTKSTWNAIYSGWKIHRLIALEHSVQKFSNVNFVLAFMLICMMHAWSYIMDLAHKIAQTTRRMSDGAKS